MDPTLPFCIYYLLIMIFLTIPIIMWVDREKAINVREEPFVVVLCIVGILAWPIVLLLHFALWLEKKTT